METVFSNVFIHNIFTCKIKTYFSFCWQSIINKKWLKMMIIKNKKSIFFVFLSLAALMISRFVYYSFDVNLSINNKLFILESVFFILMYLLSLLEVSLSAKLVCFILGSIFVGWINAFFSYGVFLDYFLPLSYFPTFLFLLFQTDADYINKKRKNGSIMFYPMSIYYLCTIGLSVYALTLRRVNINVELICCLVLQLFEVILYLFISNGGQSKKSNNIKTLNSKKNTFNLKQDYVLAVVSMPISFLFSLVSGRNDLAFTVLILWLVNLLLLNEKENPLTVSFLSHFKSIAKKIL